MEQNKRFQHIIEMQDELNENTTKNWVTAGLDWDLAVLAEAVEAADSTPWKWWKSGQMDIANLQVESVDLLHFLVSKSIVEVGKAVTLEDMVNGAVNLEICSTKLEPVSPIKAIVGHTLLNNTDLAFIELFKLFAYLEMSVEDIYNAYISKNLLNGYRIISGYADEDVHYIKNFSDGREDNEVFKEIYLSVVNNPDVIDLETIRSKTYEEMDRIVSQEKISA